MRPKATVGARRRVPLAAAAGGAALALAAALGWFAARTHSAMPAIAVLPFDNLSADADSAFFTDGLHDTVIGHLSRVAGLKVISRTSVMGYRGQHTNLKQIAHDLGATSILEGSVQRAGSKLRVAAQLIDVATDTHLWSSEYDRDLADVFAVQADIAQQVAKAVQVRLTPQEQASIQAVPTRNTEAYELYQRGAYEDRFGQGAREDIERALAWYERAVALDPEFALGYAALSVSHASMYWWDYDHSATRLEQARAAAERALQIAPDLPEAKLALGRYWYWGHRDYARAHGYVAEALEQRPGDAQASLLLGYIERRQGRMHEALANLRRGRELDPLNPEAVAGVGETLMLLRDYAASVREWARFAGRSNVRLIDESGAAAVFIIWKGDFSQMAPLVPKLQAQTDLGDAQFVAYIFHFWSGRPAEAIAVLQGWREDWVPVVNDCLGTNFTYPKAYLLAQAYRAKGDPANATAQFAVAKRVIEAGLARTPDDARMHAELGVTLAALGDRSGALAAAKKAGELMPISRDALVGPGVSQLIAQTHAWLGDADAAVALLDALLKAPTHVTPAALRLNPVWEPLRQDPRFQKLIAG